MLNPFVVINAGHRGVKTTFGKVEHVVFEEGLHFRIPIMQQVKEINVQIQKAEGDGDAPRVICSKCTQKSLLITFDS